MTVVLDGAFEHLLVVVELERSQAHVFQSLSGDNVDGRLGFSSTDAIDVAPLVWHYHKKDNRS